MIGLLNGKVVNNQFLNCSKDRKLKWRNFYRVSLVELRKIKGDCLFLKYGDRAL